MKIAYPIIMTRGKEYIVVFVPDFNVNTQGKNFAEAMEMARDLIGTMGIDMEDENEVLPTPSDINNIPAEANQIISLVDVDFTEYRRKMELKTVKKNCTIPSWLNYEAEKANINFSGVLQDALMERLNISKSQRI